MDQRLRLATAAAVMLLGLGFALFFRRPTIENSNPLPLQSDPLVLRREPDPQSLAGSDLPSAAAQARPQAAASAAPPRPSPTIVTATDRPAPPPELPNTFPDARGFNGNLANGGQAASTRWGTSLGEMLPNPEGAPASAPPTHKVIDGDSLAMLAERYLGSASRAMEIFAANRDVLTEPDILPMGVELKIPRAEQQTAQRP